MSLTGPETEHLITPKQSLWAENSSETLSEDIELSKGNFTAKYSYRNAIIHWTLHGFSALTVLLVLFYSWNTSSRQITDCALRHNTWSPALDTSRDAHELRQMKGTFDGWTPFKGPPRPEVKKAWESITDINTVNLTAETMQKLGRSLDSVQYPDEYGGGYLAQLEAAHHLHCLYAIWKDHHITHFPDMLDERANSSTYYERHYEHCVDIIRQRLMCVPDPGLVTFRWVRNSGGPEPDFNTLKQCTSYEHLLDWNRKFEAVIDVDKMKLKKPADAVQLRTAP